MRVRCWILTAILLVGVTATARAQGAVPWQVVSRPLEAACVMKASEGFGVPLAVILGVMVTEGGKVGRYSVNTNGTRDLGPMQINTIWLPKLAQYGITEQMLLHDGCLNVMTGTWILRGHLAKNPLWDAIGAYHSKTPHLKSKYQWKVWNNMQSIRNVGAVIDRANSSLRRIDG